MAEVAYKPAGKISKIYDAGKIEQPKYYPSYFEWLYQQGEVIIVDYGGNLGGGVFQTLYQVPQGYTFFLTSSYLTMGSVHNAWTLVYFQNRQDAIHQLNTQGTTSSMSYPIPLMVPNNETITIFTWVAGWTHAGIQGFLVPNHVLVRI